MINEHREKRDIVVRPIFYEYKKYS